MSEEQLPDWLLSMRGQSLDDVPSQPPEEQVSAGQPDEPMTFSEPAAETVSPFVGSWDEEEQASEESAQESGDMVDFLRDMVQDDDEVEDYNFYSTEKVSGVIPGTEPWQSLVLAVLFGLDVLVCGCMALAMLQRIGF
jgi:hypothetical protein